MALSGFWWIRRAARHNLPVWCRLCDSRLTLFTRSLARRVRVQLSRIYNMANIFHLSALCATRILSRIRWVFWPLKTSEPREWNVNFVVCWCQVTCMKSLARTRGEPCIIAASSANQVARTIWSVPNLYTLFRCERGWVMGRQFVWSLARDTFTRRMHTSHVNVIYQRDSSFESHTRRDKLNCFEYILTNWKKN